MVLNTHPPRVRKALMLGLALGMMTAACSRSNDDTDNVTTVETVDPMTNESNAMGTDTNASTGLSSETGGATGTVSNSTGAMATDATNTMSGTNSSGPSDTRGTRGEGTTRPNMESRNSPPPR